MSLFLQQIPLCNYKNPPTAAILFYSLTIILFLSSSNKNHCRHHHQQLLLLLLQQYAEYTHLTLALRIIRTTHTHTHTNTCSNKWSYEEETFWDLVFSELSLESVKSDIDTIYCFLIAWCITRKCGGWLLSLLVCAYA